MRGPLAGDVRACAWGKARGMTISLETRTQPGTAIRLRSVVKNYGTVRAVRGVDLSFAAGETIALLGPNGAGKSTTIGMLLGLVTPDFGDISIDGLSPRKAVAKGAIAAMLQDSGLMPGVRIGELVRLAERIYPHSIPTTRALELAGLTELSSRRVDKLSGGQAQRLRFALAIVANPDILLLDEPTRALDVQGRAEFWASMRAYAATGKTILFATHYLDEVDENATRVVVMAGGRVVADGDPADIRNRTGITTVRVSIVGHDLDDAWATRLPGVVEAITNGARLTLRTTDPDATVRALSLSDLIWRALEVTPPSLDESFLILTKEQS
jgi:ABC-2 type transport system ATP-binding protein